MADKEKEYVCAYNRCLHSGLKVKASEAVVLGKKYYHWDCALVKQEIQDCVRAYMQNKEDKTEYPIVTRIINTLVFKNRIPTEYIKEQIERSKLYYASKPPYVLYGLRRQYWELEVGE